MGRKRAKRDYWNYTLRNGRFVVKHGISKNPGRRLQELEARGLKFSTMIVDRVSVSEETARKREEERVESYQRRHKGKKPKYNK